MELPAYHMPTFNGIMMHTWHRLRDFVLRAGQTILSVIALMYVLQMIYIPTHWHRPLNPAQEPSKITVLEAAGKVINPVFRPMGIRKENWHASVALVSGLFAKEAIVGSLQTLYTKRHNETLSTTVKRHFGSNSAGFAYLLFILLYSPCAAALTMLWKEHGKGWTGFAFVYLTALAWMLATLFYQISQIWVQPLNSAMWIAITLSMGTAGYFVLHFTGIRMKHAAQI
jgi:ferrous iron transport protein B